MFIVRYFVMIIGLFPSLVFVSCGSDSSGNRITGSAATEEPELTYTPSSEGHMKWEALPIKFMIDSRFSAPQKEAILRAMSTWETAAEQDLFKIIEGNPVPDLETADGISGIFLSADGTGVTEGAIASAYGFQAFNNDLILTEAEIYFDGSRFTFVEGAALLQPVDLETIALHELGHALGLPHVDPAVNKWSIMTPSMELTQANGNLTVQRSLAKLDIAMVRAWYP